MKFVSLFALCLASLAVVCHSSSNCTAVTCADGGDPSDSVNRCGIDTNLTCCTWLEESEKSADAQLCVLDQSCAADQWSMQPVGKSAQIRLYDSCHPSRWIKLKMESLQEYTIAGSKVSSKVSGFANVKSDWLTIAANDSSTGALENHFNASFKQSKGDFWLLVQMATREFTSHGVTVLKNALKFTLDIGWNYHSTGNDLEFCIAILSKKGSGAKSTKNKVGGKKNKVYYLDTSGDGAGQVVLYNPTGEDGLTLSCSSDANYSTDGTNLNMTIEGQKNKYTICYRFGYCSGNIRYDPVLSMGDSDDSDSGVRLFGVRLFGVALIASVALALVYGSF